MSRIVLTDGTTPADVSSGQTQVYTKSGSGGLFYKQGADPEVGPLGAGGGGDLQTAYDAGASIATTVADGAVSISSTLPGGPDALAVTVGGSTNATGVLVTNSGPGAAVAATALGSGNAVEVEANDTLAINVKVNGTGVGARGLVVDLTSAGSQGTGIEVSVDSTGTGFYLLQAGNGIGIDLVSDSTSNEAIRVETTDSTSTSPAIRATTQSTNFLATAITARVEAVASAARGILVEMVDSGALGRGIDISQAGGGNALYATSASTSNAAVESVVTGAGTAHAIKASVTNASSTGSAIRATTASLSGSAPAIQVEVTVASAANGLVVDVIDSGSTGTGISIGQAGTGDGVTVSVNDSNAYSCEVNGATSSARGLLVAMLDNASVGTGIRVAHGGVGNGLEIDLVAASPGNAIEVTDSTPATVFTVDSAGNTTTPSVIFGGSGTITVEGDSGVAGSPINPRVSLTSGSVGVGVLARTWYAGVKEGSGAGPFDMETVVGGQYTDIRDEQPTLIQWDNTSGGAQTAYLPDAGRYPLGAEIQFWNISVPPGNNVTLTDFGAAGQQIRDLSSVSASQTVTPGSGRRLVSLGLSGWFVTGVI